MPEKNTQTDKTQTEIKSEKFSLYLTPELYRQIDILAKFSNTKINDLFTSLAREYVDKNRRRLEILEQALKAAAALDALDDETQAATTGETKNDAAEIPPDDMPPDDTLPLGQVADNAPDDAQNELEEPEFSPDNSRDDIEEPQAQSEDNTPPDNTQTLSEEPTITNDDKQAQILMPEISKEEKTDDDASKKVDEGDTSKSQQPTPRKSRTSSKKARDTND